MADEPSLSVPEEEITLFAGKNDEVLVWSAEDVHKLRTQYRIVGSLVGSLPRKPKQNVYLSLPLLISKDETTLLLEKKFARLVKSQVNPPLPSQDEIERFRIAREESTSGQIKLFREEDKGKEREFADCIEAGRVKKKKRGRKRQKGKEDDSMKPSKLPKTDHEFENLVDDETVSSEKLDNITTGNIALQNIESLFQENQEKPVGKQSDIDRNEPKTLNNLIMTDKSIEDSMMDSNGLKVSVTEQQGKDKTFPSEEPWTVKESTPMEQACVIHIPTKIPKNETKDFPTQEWNYPLTEIEKLKYQVFLDLWEKGFYITSGSKFGGDYLAYPGDPVKFHSFYVIIAIPWTKKIGMLELISIGRLAATVKKTAVLGTVSDKGEIVYSSIKWSGIS